MLIFGCYIVQLSKTKADYNIVLSRQHFQSILSFTSGYFFKTKLCFVPLIILYN